MRRPTGFYSHRLLVLAVVIVPAVLVCTSAADTGSSQQSTAAHIGPSSPLPVLVTNEGYSLLPDGFVSGSRWRFTSWTAPSTNSWICTVEATTGPWANLTIHAHDGTTTRRWYNVPAMPGGWEKQ